MTDQKIIANDTFIDHQISAAGAFLDSGNHGAALEIYEDLLERGVISQPLYVAAARAFTAAIVDKGFPDEWTEERRTALARRLIVQTGRDGAPPALAAAIAAVHAAGTPDSLAGAAAALRPAISALWDEGCRSSALLVIVLLLREPLESWRDQTEISRWHIETLPHLDRHELTLPYNSIFDPVSFRRNVADLKSVVEGTSPAELARRFPAWQLLLFHWIIGSGAYEQALPALLAELRSAHPEGPSAPDDRAAIHSLALRWASLGHGPAGRAALTDALGEELAALAGPWAALHSSDGRTADARKAKARLTSRPRQAAHFLAGQVVHRAPFLKLGRRRPRIAVCISGQLRGYRRALPTWQAGLLRNADCQFVVHSWEKVGRSGAEPYRAYLPFAGKSFCDAWRVHARRAGMATMLERYPHLFAALREGGEVRAEDLCDFYGTEHVVLEDDGAPKFEGWSNSRKMHYKIAAGNGLLDRLDDDVDLVLRIRPDKELGAMAFAWSDALSACRSSATLLADSAMGHQFGRIMIGDQVALASRQVMAVYADTLNLTPRLAQAELYSCDPNLQGHTSLALTCWHAGIDVRRLPVRVGALLEAEPMASDQIAAALEADAAGRMDAMDQTFLSAIRPDIRSNA